MMRFLSLTNIPTPYRIYFYNILHEELAKRDVMADLLFMDWTEPGRHWTFTKADLPSHSRVMAGIHPVVRGRQFHLNLGYLSHHLRKRPDIVLMSGSWYFLTNQMLLLLKSIAPTRVVFWSESNLEYVEHEEKARRWRTWTYRQFDAFVVPGQMAKEYIEHFTVDQPSRPIFEMPNIVDHTAFMGHVAQLRATKRQALYEKWVIAPDQIMLLIAARLEPIKGVDLFLEAFMALEDIQEITLIIAGTGSREAHLKAKVQENRLTQQVRFVGHVSEPDMLELLAIADGFVLPSLGDPYPLSVIEALFAALPLLLSERVGCGPEALNPTQNGYLFDPTQPEQIQDVVRQFTQQSPTQRADMGQKSLQIAQERFMAQPVINTFLDQLLAWHSTPQTGLNK